MTAIDWIRQGLAHHQASRLAEAEACYRKALELAPGHPDALGFLGVIAHQVGRNDVAIDLLSEAIRTLPDNPRYHNNLAEALRASGQLDAATQHFRRAIELRPDYAEALNNLAILCQETGRVEEAIAMYERSVAAQPQDAHVFSNLLMALNYRRLDPQAVFERHREWSRRYEKPLGATPHAARLAASRKIRIGYMSADFAHHAVAFFAQVPIAHHDRSKFDVFLYSDVLNEDRFTAQFKQYGTYRSIIQLSDDQASQLVRHDAVDILVDLAGHSGRNRLGLMARRPAPVQITWIGYPNTTGLDAITHRITDSLADPPGPADQLHTEHLLRLPGCFLCYRPYDAAPPVAALPALSCGVVTFGSFNNLAKLSDQTVALWAGILRQTPGSRLMLKARALATDDVRRDLRRRFAACAIAPDRLVLSEPMPAYEDHLAAYAKVDIALDSLPYNGTTTTCEALWQGVPVITLAGDSHVSRVGASLLQAAGLGDLVAETPDQYAAIAAATAGDLASLATLRAQLRSRLRASPLLDAPGFTRGLDAALASLVPA